MLDRDKEIEALALRMLEDAMAAPDALWPIEASEARRNWSNARQAASLIIQARDEDRSTRNQPPAPAAAEPTRASEIEDLAADAVAGLRYIEMGQYGRIYGVGWDRVFENAERLKPQFRKNQVKADEREAVGRDRGASPEARQRRTR